MTSTGIFGAAQEGSRQKVVHIGPNPFRDLWSMGYKRLIPIIPPGAPLYTDSHLAKRVAAGRDPRGKCPGVKWPTGNWSGFDWVKHEAEEPDLIRWNAMGANQGVKTGHGLHAIDADLSDETWARAFQKLLDAKFGPLPQRIGKWPKALYPIRTDMDCPYMRITVGEQDDKGAGDRVEILGEGKQFVAGGRHPGTQAPYQWTRPLVPFDALPFATTAQLKELLEEARALLPGTSTISTERGLNESETNQESLLSPSLFALRDAVRATPNTSENFATRESYLGWGYAIKASAVETDQADAFDIFWEWCQRWTGGRNIYDTVRADWARMKPPFRRGWPWLSSVAERLSLGAWSQWSVWMEPIVDTHESLFGDFVFGDPKENETARETGGPLNCITALEVAGVEPPPQAWIVKDLIPARQVTLLGGDGGNGKSLLALQLAVAKSSGASWLDFPAAEPMRTLFLTAEDEKDELLRRLQAIEIMRTDGQPSAYSANLHLVSLDGEDAVLASASRRDGLLAPTVVFKRLWATLEQVKPQLLILDTLADIFGGAENDRVHARQFIGFMRKIVKNFNLSIVLLYHPSVAGMSSGAGTAGNTAWSNSVRSRLYLDRLYSDETRRKEWDEDVRVITVKKNNRAKIGANIRIRYNNGLFIREDQGMKSEAVISQEVETDAAFLGLLDMALSAGMRPNGLPRSPAYAPAVLQGFDTTGMIGKQALEASMRRLMAAGTIRVTAFGPASRRVECLQRETPATSASPEESLFS